GYQLLSSEVQKNNSFIDTYRATLTNAGAPIVSAIATLNPLKGSTKIIDGSLTFGRVGSGASVVSSDTFSLSRNRNAQVDLSALVWTITATPNHRPVANAGPD